MQTTFIFYWVSVDFVEYNLDRFGLYNAVI